jgi:hypothetical protein
MNVLEVSVIVTRIYSLAVVVVNRNTTVIQVVTIVTGNVIIPTYDDDDINKEMCIL